MPSGREYSNRIAEQAHRAMAPRLQTLESAIQAVRTSIADAVAPALSELEALRGVDWSFSAGVVEEAIAESMREKNEEHRARMTRLAAFAGNLRRVDTQRDILEALLELAGQISARAVLFAVREGRISAWAARGYPEEVAAKAAGTSFPLEGSSALAAALGAETRTDIDAPRGNADLWDILGCEDTSAWHLFPLSVLDRRPALLLAESNPTSAADLDGLRAAVEITSLRLENVSLKMLEDLRRAEETGEGLQEGFEDQPPAGAEAAAPLPAEVAAEASSATVPGAEPEARPESAETAAAEPPAEVAAEEHPVLVVQEASAPPPEAGHAPAAEEPQPSLEEEKHHADARRFARLLVSEIKLYNEQKVIDGRERRDIYDRLKRDIDRSREMYEKRISPWISSKYDYFHDEVVRILADGDPERLGSDYPGPRAG